MTTRQAARDRGSHREGGPFTAVAACPRCTHLTVHPMRPPNPNPPEVNGYDVIRVDSPDGSYARHTRIDRTDRWDERGFDVIRICVDCGWEWGQT